MSEERSILENLSASPRTFPSLARMTFAISLFAAPATTSTAPMPRDVGWEQLVALLTRHDRRVHKDGGGWSPARLRPGTTRANEHVIELSLAVGDFDHCTMEGLELILQRIEALGLAAIVYSTYSNTPPDDVRFRVVVPLAKPVPREQWADAWRRISTGVFGGRNDPQTSDPSRMYYLPAAPPGVPVFTRVISGAPLDLSTVPAGGGPNGHAPARPLGERIPQGERNNTLTSLAGTMRCRGMSETAMAAALLEENHARCDPPLDEKDVRRIAASVARYAPGDVPRHGFSGAVSTAVAEVPPAWTPTRLIGPEEEKQAARGTWLDDYIAYAAGRTDAPRAFHEALGLVVLSTVIGRRAVLHWMMADVYPALWVLILADSTLFRKSTAMDLARDLLERVDRELLAPNDFTPQRFVAVLAEHDGRPLLFARDEFSGFYEALNKLDFMAGAKETLCNVYDGRPFRREKMKPKKGKSGSEPSDEEWRYDVREPFLTMAVGTTIERFFDVARAGDLHSGFLPRFALVLPPDQPAETRPLGELTEAAERERAVLVQRLQELQEQVITLRVAPEVFERFNEYLAALEVEAREAPNPNLVAIIGGRVSWMAMHAAMALAAAEVPQRVMLPHLLRGIALAENWRHNAIRTLGALAPSRFERLAARVVQLVDQKARIARREVMRTLHLNRREIDDLQATLSERGEIIIEPQQGGSGPAAIWYRTAKPVTPVALVTGGISNGAREVPDSEDIEELVEWRA